MLFLLCRNKRAELLLVLLSGAAVASCAASSESLNGSNSCAINVSVTFEDTTLKPNEYVVDFLPMSPSLSSVRGVVATFDGRESRDAKEGRVKQIGQETISMSGRLAAWRIDETYELVVRRRNELPDLEIEKETPPTIPASPSVYCASGDTQSVEIVVPASDVGALE